MAKAEPSNSESGASDPGSELARLREQIDAVDRAILERLNERAKWVLEVGRLKQSRGVSVYEEAREKRIVSSLVESNPGPFPDDGLAPVFREIISATRSLEDALSIAYMGPQGTFSHEAANLKFGRLAALESVPSISDVFAAVERGTASLGKLGSGSENNSLGWGIIDADAAIIQAKQLATAVEDETPIPDVFEVLSPYPNPFSDQTVFEIRAPANAGFARMSVYNLLGQRVALPFEGRLNPGVNRIVLRAATLPAGLYLYTVEGDRVSHAGKVVLVR
jgi:chorismate mutase